ncbi:MAG: hypothetical protein L6W00_05965 [Lentisphaeria bacterium]|nr:MAG: hypothetical protein L6W00_05965 [Lentisphaeria bacterium]
MNTVLRNFSVNALTAPADIDDRIGALAAKALRIAPAALLDWRILAKSIDSRRGTPQLVYTLLIEVEERSAAARKLEPVPPEMLVHSQPPAWNCRKPPCAIRWWSAPAPRESSPPSLSPWLEPGRSSSIAARRWKPGSHRYGDSSKHANLTNPATC